MAITFAIKRLTSAAILQPSSSKDCGPVMVDCCDVLELVQSYKAATDEIEKLRSERDDLMAQNHELKGLIMRLRDRWWPFVHGSVVPSSTAYNLGKESADVLCKSPQQHLAEIKAEAIESVITEELYKRLKPLCGKNGVSEAEDYLTEQAAKIRQGEL